MLANIHGRLSPLDRLAFAALPEAPWLVLPGGDNPDTSTLFSLSDRIAITLRALQSAMCGQVFLGSSSSGGWLVIADDRARIRLVNPVNGKQRALPAITTILGLLEKWGGFSFMMLQPKDFLRGPPYHGGDRPPQGTFTMGTELMRRFFYRKVVLSDSDPPGPAAAILITGPRFGVEDAVHYNGKFHSITYAGAVEMWEQDGNAGGVFTSMVVAPRLPNADGDSSLCCRKYLVAAAGRRLMVVLKEFKEETTDKYSRPRRTCSFKVQALTANSGGKRTISGTPHCLWG
ncbi:uncharacterized protein [Aegilops tauschii subsp. strangulata]|uniref:uncharacterized protein n=1 Tax=Aegilops tauschii subsp. strangulata TaxID=200361 RepID=UPI003CC87402